MTTFSIEIKNQSIYHLDESTRMLKKCWEQLKEHDLWKKPSESTNSIGNLILHLCGNITQYIISSLGKQADSRERDKEFSTKGGYNKAELLQKMVTTVETAKKVIEQASEEDLLQKRNVQGFHFSGIGIILQVVEHYSYHTGQIALLTKSYYNKDLGFYDGFDLLVKND